MQDRATNTSVTTNPQHFFQQNRNPLQQFIHHQPGVLGKTSLYMLAVAAGDASMFLITSLILAALDPTHPNSNYVDRLRINGEVMIDMVNTGLEKTEIKTMIAFVAVCIYLWNLMQAYCKDDKAEPSQPAPRLKY